MSGDIFAHDPRDADDYPEEEYLTHDEAFDNIGHGQGIGYVIPEDQNVLVVEMENCLRAGEYTELASKIVESLGHTFGMKVGNDTRHIYKYDKKSVWVGNELSYGEIKNPPLGTLTVRMYSEGWVPFEGELLDREITKVKDSGLETILDHSVVR